MCNIMFGNMYILMTPGQYGAPNVEGERFELAPHRLNLDSQGDSW